MPDEGHFLKFVVFQRHGLAIIPKGNQLFFLPFGKKIAPYDACSPIFRKEKNTDPYSSKYTRFTLPDMPVKIS
jgi:hypothetical protein